MTLRVHTVEFPPAQLAAQRRIDAVLARAPRLRTDPTFNALYQAIWNELST